MNEVRRDGLITDDKWPRARLIPITAASGVEAQEQNAVSALLAVASAVKEFGRSIVKPLGAPAGAMTAFVEIPLDLEGKGYRPDGLIVISRGSRSWTALVEAKVGAASLETEQMNAYLDIAREQGIDAILSLSNHYVTSSSQYPIEVDRRKLKKVNLVHRSWIDVLTEAVLQKDHRGVSDPDQAYILSELIRYLTDPRSGVVTFNSMGPSWTKVKDGARSQTLRKSDPEVGDLAVRWDELVRYLCLDLTMKLGRDVRQVLPKSEATAASRLNALKDSLGSSGVLYATLSIPDVAGDLRLAADLRARQVIVSTEIDAPKEGRSKGRLSWLLRQLQGAPEDLRVEAKVARSQASLAEPLAAARAKPESLHPPGGRDIRAFDLSLARNMGLNRDRGRGSFIDSVSDATEDFYGLVLQNLRVWKPSPPKLRPKDGEGDLGVPLPEGVEEAVEAAYEEATQQAGPDQA